jgi:hypothetical protein
MTRSGLSGMKSILSVASLAVLLSQGCSQSVQLVDNDPAWVRQMIVRFQSEPVTNPPREVWRSELRGEIVYYVPPICCDQFGLLYDATGQVVCAPDGGISGHGDGRCPEYSGEHRNDRLVWHDPRTR